jgi:integrase/recombinase XerD
MRRPTPLMALVQSYFQVHLRRVRGASDHTIRAYRDGLRLFFAFAAQKLRRSVSDLSLDDLRTDMVLAFLDHLESGRANSAVTRNCRRAAICGLVEHVLRHDPTRAEQYRQVLAIPSKRSRSRPPTYLEPEEARLLIAQPDTMTKAGARDRALLLILYNTGARVTEALGIRPEDLTLARPRQVRLHGKGGKDRFCPLWAETADAVRHLLDGAPDQDGPIFRSARGAPLTRDGAAYLLAKHARSAARKLPILSRRRITPHVLRHSCAVALLQSGVDLTVIRDYLGHVSVATTGRYLSSNMQMKREVLEAFWQRAGLEPKPAKTWRAGPSLLAFLDSL